MGIMANDALYDSMFTLIEIGIGVMVGDEAIFANNGGRVWADRRYHTLPRPGRFPCCK